MLSKGLRRANLPFTIAFTGALFIFLHALSGAGYVDPDSDGLPATSTGSTLNYSHLVNASLGAHEFGYAGFAEHWASLKQAFLSCPPEENAEVDMIASNNHLYVPVRADAGEDSLHSDAVAGSREAYGGMGVGFRTLKSTNATTPKTTRASIECVRDRLSSAIGLYGSDRLGVMQEDRAFKISFVGLTSRTKGGAQYPALDRELNANQGAP